MTLANNQLIRSEDLDQAKHQEMIAKINQQRIDGATFEAQRASLSSARMLALTAIYFRTFDTEDGCIAIACASRGLQERLSKALGFADRYLGISQAAPIDEQYYPTLQAEVERLVRAQTESMVDGYFAGGGRSCVDCKIPRRIV